MRSRHRQRMTDMGAFATPEPNSPAWSAFKAALDKAVPPAEVEKQFKKQWQRMVALTIAQATNGAGLPADVTLREFLREYNSRVVQHGLNSLPSSFNCLEAFFEYDPQLICFRLRPETDHQFSWAHFIDHATSVAPRLDMAHALQALPENKVLSYSSIDDPGALMFSGSTAVEFGILAFSMVRHGPEVTVLLTGGQTADLEAESARAVADFGNVVKSYRPYLEATEATSEAVPLASTTPLWRVLAAARFDIEDKTENARFVLEDCGRAYRVVTDDTSVFLDAESASADAATRRIAETLKKRLREYSVLFDLCATALHLPTFIHSHSEDVQVQRSQTEFRAMLKEMPRALKEPLIPASERLAFRNVERLEPKEEPLRVPERHLTPPSFRYEATGYWRRLEEGEVGADKAGNPEPGRTWVTKRLTWFEGLAEHAAPSSGPASLPPGRDPGWIYVMRMAMHPVNVFKVGLTRRSTNERAAELSGTNSPDVFHVVNEWPSGDCAEAEKQIHRALADARVKKGREFFEKPLREIVAVVNDVIESQQ